MTERNAIAISRRAFLAGGALVAGSLLLPKVPGTANSFLVPFTPEAAWADELGAAGSIMVVGRKQIGVAVGDMGTFNADAQTIRALSGAKVTIHSHYNNREVTGTTDATGRAVFDIDALAEPTSVDSAEPTDSNGKKLEYCFNGSITVTRQGYREMVIPLMRIRSVSAFIAPTRIFREGEPYLRQFSFDRWDLQYMDATFVSSSENDQDHTFTVDAWVPANKTVQVRLHYAIETEGEGEEAGEDGRLTTGEIGSATFKGAGSGGFQSASFTKRYLCPSWPKEALPVGCKIFATLECDGTTATIESGMKIEQAPFVDDEDGEIDVIPEAHMGGGGLKVAQLPSSGLPKPFAGSSFSLWKPSFANVMYDFSPLGYFMIGLKLGSLKLTKDAGPFETAGWTRQTKESVRQQYEKVINQQLKDIADVRDMYKPDAETGRRKRFNHDCTKEVAIKGCFQVYVNMAYDEGSSVWSGSLNAVIGGGVEASWTIQMLIVIVPVYISFELGAQVTAGLKFAARSHGSSIAKLLENAVYEKESSGGGLSLTISVGVTLGVGVADVLCAYIRGEGYITMSVFYQDSSEMGRSRLRLGVGLECSLGVQVLLFSWNGKLWSGDWPGLYDSYDDASDAAAALADGGAIPLDENGVPRFTIDSMARDMSIVTNAKLAQSAEFEATDSAMAPANNEPLFVEPVDLGDDMQLWDVPSQGGADDADAAPLDGENGEDYFIYLGKSNTGATVPSKDAPAAGSIGISDVSQDVFGGVKPSVDKRIFTNVFSDPRTKTIYSTMFRIATVNYGDQARTRVVYTSVTDSNWDDPCVIDFKPCFNDDAEAVSREDMYDYDFAVTALNGLFGEYLYLMIISGTRPQGDDTTFVEASSKTIVSVVRLYNSYFKQNPWRCDNAVSWSPNKRSDRVVTFSSPCIASYADNIHFDRETNSCVMGACLVRMARASNPEELFREGAARYLLTFHMDHRGRNEFKVVTRPSSFDRLIIPGSTKLVMGPIAFDSTPQYGDYDRVDRHAVIGTVGPHGGAFTRIEVKFDKQVGSTPTIVVRYLAGLDESSDVQRLYSAGADGEFYAIRTDTDLLAKSAEGGVDTSYRRDGRLYLVRVYNGGATYTPITPEGTCIPSELLVSRDGRYLFYMVNKEGRSSRGFVGEGEVGPEKTAEQQKADNSYRVMALARVGNLVTKPFALAVLDHPLDYMTSMVSWGSTATLIGAEITDPQNSIADIHDIRIPLAAVATPLSVDTEGPFAFAGEDTVFDIAVRNDGNTILSGATFNLYDVVVGSDGTETAAAAPAASADVDFQPGLVTLFAAEDGSTEPAFEAPAYDLEALPAEFAASPLANAAESGLLVPGQIQSYKVTFHIPDSWASSSAASGAASSRRKVRVRVTNPRYLKFDADTASVLAANAGDGAANSENGIVPDNSNGDFEDLTAQEWAEFFDFLTLLSDLYEEADASEWPETELTVLDAGLPLENLADLHNGEGASSSNGPAAGSSSGNGNGEGPATSKGTPHPLADTGDHNLLGHLLFG